MEWISVKDKLPADDVPSVLAFVIHQGCLGLSSWCEVVYYNGDWRSFSGSKTFDDGERVTHWIPLPEPPSKDWL